MVNRCIKQQIKVTWTNYICIIIQLTHIYLIISELFYNEFLLNHYSNLSQKDRPFFIYQLYLYSMIISSICFYFCNHNSNTFNIHVHISKIIKYIIFSLQNSTPLNSQFPCYISIFAKKKLISSNFTTSHFIKYMSYPALIPCFISIIVN